MQRDSEKNNTYKYYTNRGHFIERLETYIARVTSHITQSLLIEIDYSYGFYLFAKSRAINRQANYLLAKELLTRLQDTNDSIATIFGDITGIRNNIILDHKLNTLPNYVERNIHSDELNDIIDDAKLMGTNRSSEYGPLHEFTTLVT